jgi:hypothetical protein
MSGSRGAYSGPAHAHDSPVFGYILETIRNFSERYVQGPRGVAEFEFRVLAHVEQKRALGDEFARPINVNIHQIWHCGALSTSTDRRR